ncbi:MAG: hypothetical protein LBJ31_10085 [Treponema sp.]|jgi:type II secretory pathway component GspD/PulD (secretin)|nr:hypothetical protein [Treponema sp.]
MKGRSLLAVFILLCIANIHAQRIRSMDFRNRAVADILLALADSAGTSVILDETVSGQATFHFSDSEFSEALSRFTEACHLYAVERDGIWYVSRIEVSGSEDAVTLTAEDTDIEALLKAVARNLGVTILYDQLPRQTVTLFIKEQKLQEVLELAVKKYPEYAVQNENSAFYIRRQTEGTSSAASRLGSSSIRKSGETYTMQIARGNFSAVVALLFRTAGREYSLLQRNETAIENLYFEGKTFDELLHLVCEQGNSDYTVKDNVYYVFEVQRRDVLKKLRDVRVIELRYLQAAELTALMPADYAASSFVKVQGKTNSLYLSGSPEELDPIEEFIMTAEDRAAGFRQETYALKFIKAEDAVKMLPKHISEAVQILAGNNLLAAVNDRLDGELKEFLALVDRGEEGTAVRLRYITSEELLKNLPPSVAKEDLSVTGDPTLVFYQGSAEKKERFDAELALLDRPKPQIRYQILVVQYQKSNNVTWDPSVSVNSVNAAEHIAGNFSNIVNVNFDIVSALGQNFAAQLNWQLGEDKARVLADTTLNGLSGQEIKFENTNTFRYLDVALDPETGKPLYTGTTREINSGLSLSINGWVSGDGMITMKVDAKVSKQDESSSTSTNPPPTSERTVNTQVRTRSGTPIIIGGLLQIEKTESKNRLPVLGYIPLLGLLFQKIVISDVTTEMVIYIVPHVYSGSLQKESPDLKNESYLRKYGGVL